VGFVVDKVASGQVFSEYFGFPCHSFHQILHPHNHPGQVQYASKWPTYQFGLHPPLCKLKKNKIMKLFLGLNKFTPGHKDVWRSGSTVPPLLTLTLDGVECSPSRYCRFNPGENAIGGRQNRSKRCD
jgi:hypothetical protein